MHDFQEQCQVHGQQCQVHGQRSKNGFSICCIDPARNWEIIFFKTMYNKTIIRFSFCDIRNNQGLGYAPMMSFPNGGRAGIQGLLTSMSCPCLGQVSNYWHRSLPRDGIIDIFGWERPGKSNRSHTWGTGPSAHWTSGVAKWQEQERWRWSQ